MRRVAEKNYFTSTKKNISNTCLCAFLRHERKRWFAAELLPSLRMRPSETPSSKKRSGYFDWCETFKWKSIKRNLVTTKIMNCFSDTSNGIGSTYEHCIRGWDQDWRLSVAVLNEGNKKAKPLLALPSLDGLLISIYCDRSALYRSDHSCSSCPCNQNNPHRE